MKKSKKQQKFVLECANENLSIKAIRSNWLVGELV